MYLASWYINYIIAFFIGKKMKKTALLIVCAGFSIIFNTTASGGDNSEIQTQSRFEIGTRGYLMDACQEALDQTISSNSGYCYGVYDTVLSARMSGPMIGTRWCPPNSENTADIKNLHMEIIVSWLIDHPQEWPMGEAFYVIELALTEAYPCTE
jgi:hypothetical protein